MKKTLTSILLAATFGLASCSQEPLTPENQEPQKPIYEFNQFGAVRPDRYYTSSVSTADLDGDGDIDIVVGLEVGGIIIYENKMPQQGK